MTKIKYQTDALLKQRQNFWMPLIRLEPKNWLHILLWSVLLELVSLAELSKFFKNSLKLWLVGWLLPMKEPQMPIRLTPHMYSEEEVRKLRDGDRRARRKEVSIALISVAALIFVIRLLADDIIKNPKTNIAIAISPYITFGVFVVGLTLLFGSVFLIFRRRF